MSDSEEERYVYSEDEDGWDGNDEDEEMQEAPDPRAKKSNSASSRDDGPARLGDGAYTLMELGDVERMMLAKSREVSETLDVRGGVRFF